MGILYSSLKFLLFGKPKRHCMDNLNFLLPTEREREARLVHVPNRQFTEQHLTLNDYLSISLFVIQNLENS